MSYTCEREASRVADFLGFSCDGANPVVTFRNPLELANWTLPVLELLIVGGAIFAFVHAWRRWRRDGDPVNIALWFGSLVYLAVIEPPLYFPSWFGLQEYVGFIFSHNVFTVQFMYDRLPLYIVAFYTVSSQLIYEIVRVLGIFERRGALVGAVAAAFVSQVFYEMFDQLGPQLRWWAWNPANEVNQPMLASVPMNSMWVFASVSFGVLVWLAVKLLGVRPGREALSGGSVAWRTVVAGVLTPVLMVVLAAPTRVGVSASGSHDLQRTLVIVLLAVLWVAGFVLIGEAARVSVVALRQAQEPPVESVVALRQAQEPPVPSVVEPGVPPAAEPWGRETTPPGGFDTAAGRPAQPADEVEPTPTVVEPVETTPPGGFDTAAGRPAQPTDVGGSSTTSPGFARIYPGIYLGVHVLLWAAALPAYFAARDGVTAAGTPIGCGPYALACIVAATLIVLITRRATSEKSASA